MISLPIDEVLPALREALATRHEAVLNGHQVNQFQ
jgi:ATP-dependent helicase HrpB